MTSCLSGPRAEWCRPRSPKESWKGRDHCWSNCKAKRRCLLRADHPVVNGRLTVRQFLALEHAVVRAEGRTLEMFEKFLARNRLHRKVSLMTPHFMSIPMIVARVSEAKVFDRA